MRPLVVELGFLYDYPGYEKDVGGTVEVLEIEEFADESEFIEA